MRYIQFKPKSFPHQCKTSFYGSFLWIIMSSEHPKYRYLVITLPWPIWIVCEDNASTLRWGPIWDPRFTARALCVLAVNKLPPHRLEKGLYLPGVRSRPRRTGGKWLRHNATNKYLRSQASADNKPDWINSGQISLHLFPSKINTCSGYIGMI